MHVGTASDCGWPFFSGLGMNATTFTLPPLLTQSTVLAAVSAGHRCVAVDDAMRDAAVDAADPAREAHAGFFFFAHRTAFEAFAASVPGFGHEQVAIAVKGQPPGVVEPASHRRHRHRRA